MKRLFFALAIVCNVFAEEPLLNRIEIYGPETAAEKEHLSQMLAPFIGKPLTLAVLGEVKGEILAYYRVLGNSLIAVTIPDQNVSDGKVKIEVRRAKVSKVAYKGNRWTNPQRFFSILPGDEIDEQSLKNDIAWFNRNPFRSTQVVLSPGSRRGTTNLEFVTQDRFPFRFFAGADNTGTSFADQARLYAGANWGNAFGVGDLLTYQFTCAPSLHRFHAHTVNYTSFLPWKHQLSLYGGYAKISPDITSFRSEAKNYQASLRYEIPFRPLADPFQQQMGAGADLKNLNSDLFFISTDAEVPIVSQSVNLFQFYGSYSFHWSYARHDWTLKAELFGSPFEWLPHQTKSAYHSLRPGSSPYYAYLRTAFGDLFSYSKWFTLSWLLRGQASTGALLPSEQFGLGGYDTVRGYKERSFNSDRALCGNLELQTGRFTISPKNRIDAYFLVFLDLAKGWNAHPLEANLRTQNLASAGAGFRLNWLPYLIGRIDYGFQLHGIPGDSSFGRLHVGLSASY